MQELIIVTHKKMIIAVPVNDVIKLSEGDSVAGVTVVTIIDSKPEEAK